MKLKLFTISILISTLILFSCKKQENRYEEKHYKGLLITYESGYEPNSQNVYENHDTTSFWVNATLQNDSIYFTTADSQALKIPTVLAHMNDPFNHSYRLTNTMRPYENVALINNDSIYYEWSYAAPTGPDAKRIFFRGSTK